jgi:hypothetical protein
MEWPAQAELEPRVGGDVHLVWPGHLEALDVVLAGGTSTTEDRNERYEALPPSYLEAAARL